MRDIALDPTKFEVISVYMELVVQFGFIALFSSVFPLAPLFSLIANQIQYKAQTQNLIYMRRGKAQVADGIGAWMSYLDLIGLLAIIVNFGTLFFTCDIYEVVFAGVNYQDLVERAFADITDNGAIQDSVLLEDIQAAGTGEVTSTAREAAAKARVGTVAGNWGTLEFLIAVVVLEHLVLLLIMAIKVLIPAVPEQVVISSIDAE
jgi:hypothetical protein